MPEANFATMSDAQAIEYCGDDAMRWAEFFCQVQRRQHNPAPDESVMVTWFANAIEGATQKRENNRARG